MKKTELNVSIVIPNYNGEELLAKNLPKVLQARQNSENHIEEIIVVDDASSDGSFNFIKEKFPDVKLVRHKVNRGFSAAVNTGVRSSSGELVCLLNTDVVPQKNFLVSAISRFQDKKVFAVSLHEEGFSWAKGVFREGFIEHTPGEVAEKTHLTFWVSGGSGLFRRSLWVLLGGLDEKLFPPFYWEDVDLSYRAAKRGFYLLWDPKANVVHEHEAVMGKLRPLFVRRIQERNQLLFIWKNLTSSILFRRHMLGLFSRITRHPGYLRVFFMAFMRLPQVITLRMKEKREAKISDEAIFARFK